LALGGLTFFGIKLFKKSKNKTNEDDLETNSELDVKTVNQTTANPVVHSPIHSVYVAPFFPLKMGAKGDNVLRLQRALIKSYGAGILKKSGADGQFGSELATALKSKGYQIPLQEADYNKITEEKKIETPKNPAPLVSFDASAIAKSIYATVNAKDFDSSITLLKGIKNTTDYSLVSEQLKPFRINGVHQTLVNAILTTFTERSQKLKIQEVFKTMGLKYNGTKWSL
jgi:peptidoglycan hydrolase-like protein with peptidoglycan-binding domain